MPPYLSFRLPSTLDGLWLLDFDLVLNPTFGFVSTRSFGTGDLDRDDEDERPLAAARSSGDDDDGGSGGISGVLRRTTE